MKIKLEKIGKRYQKEWIFKDLDFQFESNSPVAILGSNGSGKSTLLQVLSGYLTPTEGLIQWEKEGSLISVQHIYKSITLASPASALYDDFTLRENITFFQSFKSFKNEMNVEEVAKRMGLEAQMDKQLKFYSSGMRQRVKLGLAIMGESDILLLDEPSSHLDAKAIQWYNDLVLEFMKDRVVCVASNKEESETSFCKSAIDILNHKPAGVRV
ncbi:MAG: ABC transporter ATP-binding protein [Flavobacteriales bacterium]